MTAGSNGGGSGREDGRNDRLQAGPYTAREQAGVCENVMDAIEAGYALLKAGHAPYIPHLTMWFDDAIPDDAVSYEEYIAWGMAILERCDAVLCIGRSPGADRECARARELGLPVYRSLEEVPAP